MSNENEIDDDDWNKPVRLTINPDRALYAAGLRGVLATRSWQDSPADRVTVERVRDWARRPEPGGLCLHGLTKRGKTGLAAAVVKERWRDEEPPDGGSSPGTSQWVFAAGNRSDETVWRQRQEEAWQNASFAPVLFTTWTNMEHQLRLGLETRRFDYMLEALETGVGLLVVDDLDVGSFTPWRESVLFSILERPWRDRRVVVTLNQNPTLSTELLTERLVSRLNNPELFLKLEV